MPGASIMWTLALCGALALSALGAPAAGQAPDNAKICRSFTNDVDLLVRACTAVIEAGDADARRRAYGTRGKAYDKKGDYDRAIRDFDDAIRLEDGEVIRGWTFADRGLAYMAKGQHDRALEDFNEAVRLTASRGAHGTYPRYARGLAHLAKAQYDRAVEDFDRAFRDDPNPSNWEARYARGVARQRKGDRTGGAADIAAVKAEFESEKRLRGLAAEWTKRGVKP